MVLQQPTALTIFESKSEQMAPNLMPQATSSTLMLANTCERLLLGDTRVVRSDDR
jgi:hypothetical protein